MIGSTAAAHTGTPRFEATASRSIVAAAFKAAIFIAYTEKIRYEAPTSRIAVAAAICRHGRSG